MKEDELEITIFGCPDPDQIPKAEAQAFLATLLKKIAELRDRDNLNNNTKQGD